MTDKTEAADMVERVARALCRKRRRFWIGLDDYDREEIVNREWPEYADDARAAIEAIQPELRKCYELGLAHASADALKVFRP